MSGCKAILILAGPTWSGRLWCARPPTRNLPHVIARAHVSHVSVSLVISSHVHACTCRCLVELFAFVQMGGLPEQILVERLTALDRRVADDAGMHDHTGGLLDGEGAAARARVSLTCAARGAQCFSEADRHLLLATIETSFGTRCTHGSSQCPLSHHCNCVRPSHPGGRAHALSVCGTRRHALRL